MLESHGNISILLSEVHEPSALRFSAKLHRLHLECARQTEGAQ